ncbi:MAG: carbon-nitrogen hydrolase family protein [Lentisphaeraceae bacterium]|nr:carbon-nitrogen hydrolase family protein [Lentisphaeraceae bacterium]
MSKLKVAIAQASSTPEIDANFRWVERALQKAQAENSELIIFPECIMCWAQGDITRQKARTLESWEELLIPLIKKYAITTVWGGLQVLEGDVIYNTSLVYSANGEFLARYEKTHLFQLFIADKINIDETETYAFGRSGPISFKINDFQFGLSICYDLRYPELYREYTGVDAIICTAAFTKKTGRAHWEPLLRARAIENQCYVLASAQCGVNQLNGIHTYGHSMGIDSWGKVLCEAQQEPDVLFVTMDKNKLNSDRQILPALKNRRLK